MGRVSKTNVVPIHGDADTEKVVLNKFINLIRWASARYSKKLAGRYDYWDFFEDGLLILAICLSKWCRKDSQISDREGFKKYFKTALFNRFRQIEIASHCKKRFGIHTPLEFASKVSTDGGFNDVFFNELKDHVRSLLNGEEKEIFNLMVDPPEDLVEAALYEAARKQKQALLLGTYDVFRIRITTGCLFNYLNKKGWRHFSEHSFLKTLRAIKKVVRDTIEEKV